LDNKVAYRVGHGARSLEEFLNLLAEYGIETIVDVRRFPGSKKFPHFNKENLQAALAQHGLEYVHIPELGGFRRGGYSAHVHSDEFKTGLARLENYLLKRRVAVMCAERLFWRCHRRFIADELIKLGIRVIHILEGERTYEHKPRLGTQSPKRRTD